MNARDASTIPVPAGSTAAYAYEADGVLVIGNRWVERRFAARVGQPFLTNAFRNRRSGRDYWRAGGREFALAVDGQTWNGERFALERVLILNARDPVEIVVALTGGGMQVEVHVAVYADHPVIRFSALPRTQIQPLQYPARPVPLT